jgi:hypothetical protein
MNETCKNGFRSRTLRQWTTKLQGRGGRDEGTIRQNHKTIEIKHFYGIEGKAFEVIGQKNCYCEKNHVGFAIGFNSMLTMEAQNIVHGSMDIVIEKVQEKMTQCQIMFFMTKIH